MVVVINVSDVGATGERLSVVAFGCTPVVAARTMDDTDAGRDRRASYGFEDDTAEDARTFEGVLVADEKDLVARPELDRGKSGKEGGPAATQTVQPGRFLHTTTARDYFIC
jgi:hypothetical protein